MEPPRGRPVRKRRRWLVIAIAVLALISVGTWALWTPVDPRLIGEWQVEPVGPDEFRPDFRLKVREDGLVDHIHLPFAKGTPGAREMVQTAGPQRLKVSGDRFEVTDDGAEGVMQVVVRLRNLVRGRRPEVFSKGQIVSIEADRLVLKFEGWGDLPFLRAKDGTLDERMRKLSTGPVFDYTKSAAGPSPRPSPRRGEGDEG